MVSVLIHGYNVDNWLIIYAYQTLIKTYSVV